MIVDINFQKIIFYWMESIFDNQNKEKFFQQKFAVHEYGRKDLT